MKQEERAINTPDSSPSPSSPRWNWTTKLIAGLTLMAVFIFLFIRFQNILGPLVMSFIIAYLFHPLADVLHKRLRLPWRLSVAIVYLILVLILVGLLTWGGFALFDQISNLTDFIRNNIDKVPDLIDEFSQMVIKIGPWEMNFAILNWEEISKQAVNAIQPVLNQAGTLAGKLASGAANTFFWFGLIFLISFFILAETEGIQGRLLQLDIPGYSEDLKRMGHELKLIWNAFIRGEGIVILIAMVVYSILLGSLGVKFFYGLAIIAGIGRLVPYIGAWVGWISFGLVALLQGQTIFGMETGWYVALIIVLALIVDGILDNFVVPRVMSNVLKVHPAGVLLAAIIGASLLGLIGIVLAAPVLASLQLIVNYIFSKLFDRDPWENLTHNEPPKPPKPIHTLKNLWQKIRNFFAKLFTAIKKKSTPKQSDQDQGKTD